MPERLWDYKSNWPEWAKPYLIEAGSTGPSSWFLTVSAQPLRRTRMHHLWDDVLLCRDEDDKDDCIRTKAMVLPLVYEDNLPDCTEAEYADAFSHKLVIQGVAMFPMCAGIASANKFAMQETRQGTWIDRLPPGCEPEDFDDEVDT